MKRTFLIAVALLFAGGWDRGVAQGTDGPVLTVGMELDYPPFETIDSAGQPSGVSVDLTKALGEYLHRPVKIQNLPFDSLIVALKTGRIDLIISSMAITVEREKSIDFSNPYCKSGLAVFLKKNSTANGVEDLNTPGMVVVVKIGTIGAIYAKAHLPQARIITMEQANACALEVAQGKADAFLYDPFTVIKYHEKFSDSTRINVKSFDDSPWGIGIAKGQDELKKQVNAFLEDYRAKGGFAKLRDRYFAKEKAQYQNFPVPFYL